MTGSKLLVGGILFAVLLAGPAVGGLPAVAIGSDSPAGTSPGTDSPASIAATDGNPGNHEGWDPGPGPIVVEGTGDAVVGPFDVREGPLTVHFEGVAEPTNTADHLLSVDIFVDNDLDGRYNNAGQGDAVGAIHLVNHLYSGRTAFDHSVEKTTMGGRVKFDVSGTAGGDWRLTIEQNPEPQDGIEDTVLVERASGDSYEREGGATVVAIDERGNRFTTTTEFTGEFWLNVFRFRDYRVYVRKPGFRGFSTTVSAEEFLALDVPLAEDVHLGEVRLERLPEGEASVIGTVSDSGTGRPIEGATVSLLPDDGGPVETRTDSAGQYRFDYDAGEPFSLEASHPSYEATELGRTVTLDQGELRTVDLEMAYDGPPDLAIETSESRIEGPVGTDLTYTATVTNNGPGSTDATLRVHVPSEETAPLYPVEVTAGGTDCNLGGDSPAECNLGTIAEGDSVDADVTVTADKAAVEGLVGHDEMYPLPIEVRGEQPVVSERIADNNRAVVLANATTHEVYGRATTVDRHNNVLPVANASVELSLDDDAVSRSDYTNGTGHYSFVLDEAHDDVRVNVTLTDKDDTIEVYTDHAAYPGGPNEIVTLRTTKFQVTGSETNVDPLFTDSYGNLAPFLAAGADTPDQLQDAGVFYANTYEAVQFARHNLSVTLDHTPVDIHLWRHGCGACYTKTLSRIQTNDTAFDSRHVAPDSPDNREHHELGHHVHADSRLGGENTYADRASTDTNHGGVDNIESTDSVTEGFAEYFALMVNGSSLYEWSTSTTQLEDNYHVIVKNGEPVADEEFLVASLLWDLADADAEDGYDVVLGGDRTSMDDNVALGERGSFKAIADPDVETVRDLYEQLRDTTALGTQDLDDDGLNDLDELFILHRFYWDRNGNNGYDEGESVGYADAYDESYGDPSIPREDHPPLAGAAIDYSIETASRTTVEPAAFRVRVQYEDGSRDYAYRSGPVPGRSNLTVVVPVEATRARIEPIVPGYDAEPFVKESDTFWDEVVTAQREDRSAYTAHTFVVEDNGVPEPTNVTATAAGNQTIDLSWSSAIPVTVVRGLDHPPRHPDDGQVVFAGGNETYRDTGLMAGLGYSYSVFAVENGSLSEGVHASATTDGPEPVEEPNHAGLLLVVAVVVFGIAGGLGTYLRRRRESAE